MAEKNPIGSKPLHAAAELGIRNRLVIPIEIWQGVTWSSGQPPVDVLAVLEEPGLIRLLPLRDWAEKLEDQQRALEKSGDQESLLAIADRYKFMQVGSEHRFSVSDEMLLHLGIIMVSMNWVYVETEGSSIRIMSPEYRNARMAKAAKNFADLP